jgi:hypothetical protein
LKFFPGNVLPTSSKSAQEMAKDLSPLDGYDPLEVVDAKQGADLAQIFEAANRRIVHNILKSYTGFFDLFSEMLQNALDAVEQRAKTAGSAYKPRIWIRIDIPTGSVKVVDNGVGMDEQEFKLCLRPNVSFKTQADLRGHKGVGATFLAYGFSYIRLESKHKGSELAAILRQGRQWAEDQSGSMPRPRFEAAPFKVAELANEDSGTSVEIIVGKAPGERPKNLSWISAQNANQWRDVLRIKTPLGGVYLQTAKFSPEVEIQVKSIDGQTTSTTVSKPEYYYPHELPNLSKVQGLRDINKALTAIAGDPNTKFNKVASEFKRLDCVWDIWGKDELLDEQGYFESALDEEQKTLIERHSVTIYACFLTSAKLWGDFNDNVLRLRAGMKIIQGGLQIASDYMVQGDLQIIPLTSTIGYQANSHVLVHFVDGNPDMGRKVFQPELKKLAEDLAVRSVNTMKKFLQHMRPDTGAGPITPDKELYEWKKAQEGYRDHNPLAFEKNGTSIALLSKPQQEQDVVALMHELIGIGVLRGFRFFATSLSDRYDSLVQLDYPDPSFHFNQETERLGISHAYSVPLVSEPKVLEYKYSFESLVGEFENEEKFAKHIDLVVCWTVGKKFKERFYLRSLLVGDEGADRSIYGSTHQAFAVGSSHQPSFEVVVLEDLINWLQNPADEEAHQKRKYKDD